MIILVIGPSGVGKSDYGEYAQKTLQGCQFFDLDSLVRKQKKIPVSQLLPKIGNDAFLKCCQHEVDALFKSYLESTAIVAVGAGALQSRHASGWLSCHPGPTIAVIASPDEVYKRGGKRNCDRSLAQFTETEYSQARWDLYNAAKYQCCVTGLSLEDARNHFKNMVDGLLKNSQSRI